MIHHNHTILYSGQTLPLIWYHGPHTVKLFKRGQVDILYENIEKESKMPCSLHPSIYIVASCDAVEVINIRFQTKEDFHCLNW